MPVTNHLGISLPIAVWLLHDDYDYVQADKYISVTTLMKPLKQIILPYRIPVANRKVDVSDFIARALGNAIHNAMEKAWDDPKPKLKALGFPDQLIDRVVVNPTDDNIKNIKDIIPVYIEQRAYRTLDGWTIGGKFDMVTEGIVNDTKSTSAFGWVYGTRDEEHIQQGSMYKWIDAGQPTQKITEDFMRVNYIFTDWSKASARQNPAYPQKRVEMKEFKLDDLQITEGFIQSKLQLIEKFKDAPQSDIPRCTDEELWRSAPQYKYFADETKTSGRSTRNFDSMAEAAKFKSEKGNKGVIITKPGEVKRCGYCAAYDICEQRKEYFPDD